MILTIEFPAETSRRLTERAGRTGQSVEDVARDLIARAIDDGPTLDSILAPFRKSVAESGMTDEDLADFFEAARDEVYREAHPT